MADRKELLLVSEIEFNSKAPLGFPLSCPTLDLAATWDGSGKDLLIQRPPAQTVSKIHQVGPPGTKAPEAVAVTWKPDGQFLAVGWSDGVVRLMGLENNKAAHHIPVCDPSQAKITSIGWATCTILGKGTTVLSQKIKDGISKEWAGVKSPANLPQELTFLEVDTALPKLSPLPTGSAGSDDDATVFTLRTGIDFLFQTPKREEYDQVNVMIVGTDDGKLKLNIYDSFAIGTFPSPVTLPGQASHMVAHASHAELSTHTLVFASQRAEPTEIHVVPMDLPFISSSPINLSLLASKLTTLQKLLRYIKQTQLHMQVEWKNTKELPSRFLRSVQGDLEEMTSGPRDIVSALYHTVVTGHAHGPIREWLVDSLAERGHKRWDKAVVSGLENLRSLVHENFLPALDRCTIILSRLRGLAQFYDDRDDIGFSVTQISRIIDIVGCLSLVGHKILTAVIDELEHFNAFSTWLRFQIDRLASSSTATEELTEKEATMNNSKVLTYLERYLTSSPLDVFFDNISKDDWQADWDHIDDGVSLLPILDSQMKKQETGQAARKALQHVEFLVSYVTACSNKVFDDIAEAKKRSVRFGKAATLSIGLPITLMDVRMCQTTGTRGVIYTALASKEADNKVYIFRSEIDIVNGISSSLAPTASCISLDARKLIDLKFLNDEMLVLLCADSDNKITVASVPVRSAKMAYASYEDSDAAGIPIVQLADMSELQLPSELAGMRPVRMAVHDKTGLRGDVPTRICLLASNRTTWRTFTTDT